MYHNCINNIIAVVFESPDGLGLWDIGLRHDEFDVLLLNARLILLEKEKIELDIGLQSAESKHKNQPDSY